MGFLQDVEGAVKGIPAVAESWANKGSQEIDKAANSVANTLGDIPGAVKGVPKQVDQWGKDVVGAVEGVPSLLGSVFAGGSAPAAAAPKAGGVVPTPADPAVTLSNQAIGTANQAMDSLISEYTKTLSAVDPYESGQVGQQASGQASQMGQNIAAGGASAQSAFGKVDATQNADYQKMAAADSQGSAGVMSALGDLRSADAQGLRVSPYAGLLTALTSGATYRAETAPTAGALSGTTPGSAPTDPLEAAISGAYNNAVTSYGLTTAGGTTPGTGNSQGNTPKVNPSTNTATGISGGP